MPNRDQASWSPSGGVSLAIQGATGAFEATLGAVDVDQAIQDALSDAPMNKRLVSPTALPEVVTKNNSDLLSETERSCVIFSWAHHSVVDRLGDIYRFNHENEALSRLFLRDHSALPSFLKKSYKYIRNYFPESILCIDTFINPEADNNTRLVVYISTTAKPKEAITKLHNLEDELDLIGYEKLDEYIFFNLEFE